MQRDSVSRAGGKKTKPQADTLSSQKLRREQVLKSLAQEIQNHKNEVKLNMQNKGESSYEFQLHHSKCRHQPSAPKPYSPGTHSVP